MIEACSRGRRGSTDKLPFHWRVLSAEMRVRCCRYAKAAGVGVAALGLALSANAANGKLGATG